MIDIVPKVTDVNSLKSVSAILALPMLCVAYFLQSGPQISWDSSIWFNIPTDIPESSQLTRLLLIFFLKSLWASFFGAMAYGAFGLLHVGVKFPVLPVISVLLLAFGILGVFGKSEFSVLALVAPFWYYACIVWALFLHSMCDQLDNVSASPASTRGA